MKYIFIMALLFSIDSFARKSINSKEDIESFSETKKFLSSKLDLFGNKTLYCSCNVNAKKIDLKSCGYKIQSDAKRASKLEWEHIVPAEAFGNSFTEWRSGSGSCIKRGKKFKGRKCAQTDPEF